MSRDASSENEFAGGHESTQLTHEAWAKALESGNPVGVECSECDYVSASPKAACVRCGNRDVSIVDLPTTGRVYSKTTIEVAPKNQGSGYQIALIDLGNARILGRIADDTHVDIDDDVQLHDTYEYDRDIVGVFKPI